MASSLLQAARAVAEVISGLDVGFSIVLFLRCSAELGATQRGL
jgi:hypothetical protein